MTLSVGMGRELTRSPKVGTPAEACWVVKRSVTCSMVALVDPDGRVVHAKPDRCPAVLAEAAVVQARTARFKTGPERTAEKLDVQLRHPDFLPSPKKGACTVAFLVRPGELIALPSHPRCTVTGVHHGLEESLFPATRSWCAVDVSDTGLSTPGCAHGLGEVSRRLVSAWKLEAPVRVLLAFEPTPEIPVFYE